MFWDVSKVTSFRSFLISFSKEKCFTETLSCVDFSFEFIHLLSWDLTFFQVGIVDLNIFFSGSFISKLPS